MSGFFVNGLKYGTAALGLLSTLSPYAVRHFRLRFSTVRPLLNVSWGFLFGSHIYELFVKAAKDSKDEEQFVEKPLEEDDKGFLKDSDKFFMLSVVASGMVVFATSCLAPNLKSLRLGAYVALFSTMANYFLVVPYVSKKKTDCVMFKAVKPETMSTFLTSVSFVAMALYAYV